MLLIIGFSLFGVYLTVYDWIYDRWEKEIHKPKGIKKELQKLLPQESHLLWKEAGRRGSAMIWMGSIFLPISFLLLGIAAQIDPATPNLRLALVFVSIILYTLWLFLIQLTTRLMNDMNMEMRLICEPKPSAAKILRKFYGKKHGKKPLIWIRRNHWLAFLILLVVAASLIS
jgi:hypothetical protein